MTTQPRSITSSITCPACAHTNPNWRFYCEACRAKLRSGDYSAYPTTAERPARPVFLTTYVGMQFISSIICLCIGLLFFTLSNGFMFGVLLTGFGLFMGYLGWGLWRHKEWARICTIMLYILGLVINSLFLISGYWSSALYIIVSCGVLFQLINNAEYFH